MQPLEHSVFQLYYAIHSAYCSKVNLRLGRKIGRNKNSTGDNS